MKTKVLAPLLFILSGYFLPLVAHAETDDYRIDILSYHYRINMPCNKIERNKVASFILTEYVLDERLAELNEQTGITHFVESATHWATTARGQSPTTLEEASASCVLTGQIGVGYLADTEENRSEATQLAYDFGETTSSVNDLMTADSSSAPIFGEQESLTVGDLRLLPVGK